MQLPEIKKQIDRAYFSVFLLADGIIHIRNKSKEEISLEQAKEIIQCIAGISDGKLHPILVSSETFSAPTAEAREFLAKKESNPYASANAYIARSLAEKLMVNAFLKFNRPARPTRMFSSEKAALEWLRTFL